MEPAIQFLSVYKTFAQRTFKETLLRRPAKNQTALDNVSLDISQGQVYGLLGSNGAGKTTLVKIIAGLISPDKGQLKIFGQTITDNQLDTALSHVGLVTNSERTFYWRMTGRENLNFFGTLYNLPSCLRKQKINRLLQQMEVEDIADRPFMTYSMGQKQRFSIARSLLNDPSILLFDEATSNLDPLSIKSLMKFVKETLITERKNTILWCTHNLTEAEKICDNLAILHQGKVVSQGTLKELQRKCSATSRFSIIVGNWQPALAFRLSIPPETVEETEQKTHRLLFACRQEQVPSILSELLKNQVKTYQCIPQDLKLEDVFEQEIQRGLRLFQTDNTTAQPS